MRLYSAQVVKNSPVLSGAHLLEMYVPALAQAVQPGQYCMARCCYPQASDPLLRRPFFIHSVDREQGRCVLLVYVRGRGTSWLAQQPAGMALDLLGPLGHGWELRPTVSNLLLVCTGPLIPAVTLLAQTAIERELAVTLLAHFARAEDVYPPALLPPEVEYHIVTSDGSAGQRGELIDVLAAYLPWADAVCCAVSPEAAAALYNRYEKMRAKRFAQVVLLHSLVCASGVCLTCTFPTASGTKLICRDGPVFALSEIAHIL